MSTHTLLLLAGYSACGKSTLLAHSLRDKIPLFGTDADAAFQQTKLPPRFPESAVSFDETLQCGTWFSGFHMRELQRLAILPDTVVVHVDITELLWNPQRIPYLSSATSSLFPRSLASLASREDNENILADYFSAPLFGRFGRIVVNTIIVPWSVIVARYGVRKERGHETSRVRDTLFVSTGPGEHLMHVANQAWLNALQRIPAQCLLTYSDDERIRIKSLAPT